jgi:mannose-6-phosphate isomerase-like protein (cupin superfamily)
MDVIGVGALDPGSFSAEMQGRDHGAPGLSLILVQAAPGEGPALHSHPYAEVIIVQEGTATFSDGTTDREVGPGHVVIVPAGEQHAFRNTGSGPLRQVDIHVSDAFVTDWLDGREA